LLAALIGSHANQCLTFELATTTALLGLVHRTCVRAAATTAAKRWPEESLEASLCNGARVGRGAGVELRRLVRDAARPPGGVHPDPIALVRLSAVARGLIVGIAGHDTVADRHDVGPRAADAVQRQLSDFRQSDPTTWIHLRRDIHGALHIRSVPLGGALARPDTPLPDEADSYDLDDWHDLNRNPPSATRGRRR
jgi:hypothetical protein